MRQYDSHNLSVHPGNSADPDVVVEVTPQLAGWDYVSFQLRRLPAHRSWALATGERETAIVVLSGRLSVESDRGRWSHMGERESVFTGLPSALYLPRHTTLTVKAETDCEFAVAQAPTDQDHEPRRPTPHGVANEVRGERQPRRRSHTIF